MNLPPVTTARSPIMALRRSPKPGAFTAHTFRTPRSLFTTSAASASLSTSSAMIKSGRPLVTTLLRSGRTAAKVRIRFAYGQIQEQRNSHVPGVVALVDKDETPELLALLPATA